MFPIRLLNLALEAFGKYLSDILLELGTLSDDISIEDLNVKYLHPLCLKLEQIIPEFVPVNISDFVTECLITELLVVYNYLERNLTVKKHSRAPLEEQRCYIETATIRLCSAILHPSTKKFKFSRAQLPSVNRARVKIFVDSFLNNILGKLIHIKCLKLEVYKYDENIILENLKVMPNLEEFTLFGCTNAVLELVCSTCQRLRILDVRNSVGVTDSSVESILKLRHLEHLNIRRTSILPQGIEKILHGYTDMQDCNSKSLLQSFKSHVEPYHVVLIPNFFPSLRSLDICVHENFNLVPLKYLKHLSQLVISFIDVEDVSSVHFKELLNDIGCQLLSLKLYDFREDEFIDVFRLIGENCSSLKSISLFTICYYWQYLNDHIAAAKYLPEIKSVQDFEVKVYSKKALDIVLPKLVNLKEIKLHDYSAAFKPLLMKLLFQVREGHLNKIYVDGCALQMCGENIIMSKLNGSYASVHLKDLVCVIDKISGENNIDVVDKSFMDIPNHAYLKS